MRQWKYWVAIIVLSLLLGWQVWHGAVHARTAQGIKAELLARDSMIRISDSLVTCLVHDVETYKTIAARVPKRIKVDRPVMVTKIEYVYVTERDTIMQTVDGMIDDYYPDANDWVIRHWVYPYTDGTFFSEWEFRPVELDLVVNEKQKGLYEAQLAGPSFLQVRDLKVNSLPIDPIVTKTSGVVIGVGVGYDWKQSIAVPTLHAGYQWNHSAVIGSVQPNQTSLNYIHRIR